MTEKKEKPVFTSKDIVSVLMVTLSSAIYAFGMNTFVSSGNLFPGGYAGITRLITQALKQFAGISISFSIIYFLLNGITTLFVWRRIGHKFVLLSIFWYTMTSVFTAVFPYRTITSDPLLISVFGGLINGFAIGISLRNNASSGGTDFIAIYTSMRFNRPTWNYLLGVNAVVLVIAGLMFGWNQALYSIIFQFVSTQVVNSMHQRYKLSRVEVVTNLPEEVSSAVFHTCRHGITKIPCEGGFTDQKHWLLIMTINTYQLKEVLEAVKKADSRAFIAIDQVERIIGNYYQKPLE